MRPLLAALFVLASTSFAATVFAARVQVEIDRLPAHNVSKALFREYMEQGRLVVIEGGASHWRAVEEWSLEWFIERFPSDAIQLRNTGVVSYEDRPTLTLGLYKQWAAEHPDSVHYFSWVNNDEDVSRASIQQFLATPDYFPDSARAEWHPEWIYFGNRGAGVDRHVDQMCEAKYSVHLKGTKRWILSRGWEDSRVEYVATLQPGDILLFFPQYWHETETLTDESLSFNSYFQWDNTDNVFLRTIVQRAHSDPQFAKMYQSCFQAGAGAAVDIETLRAVCKELLRATGGSRGTMSAQQQQLTAMCQNEHTLAAAAKHVAATDNEGEAKWKVSMDGPTLPPATTVETAAKTFEEHEL